MPLLEIIQVRRVTANIRLEESTAVQIDQYAAFLRATADEVVDKALAYVFAKDRDFQEFLRTPAATAVPASLQVRTTSQNTGSSDAGDASTISAKSERSNDSRPRS